MGGVLITMWITVSDRLRGYGFLVLSAKQPYHLFIREISKSKTLVIEGKLHAKRVEYRYDFYILTYDYWKATSYTTVIVRDIRITGLLKRLDSYLQK